MSNSWQRGNFLSFFFLMVTLVLASGCGAFSNGNFTALEVEYWNAEPGGALQSGAAASQVDLADTLSIGGEDAVWVYGLKTNLGVMTVEATLLDLSSSASSTLVDDVIFGGGNWSAGDVVNSEIDTSVTSLRSLNSLMGFSLVNLGYTYGFDRVVVDASISGDTDEGKGGTVFESGAEKIDEWLPVLGLIVQSSIPFGGYTLSAEADLSGMWFNYGDVDGGYRNSTLRLGFQEGDSMVLGVGYRSVEVDIDSDSNGNSSDLDLGGGFFFLEWAL